MRAAGCNSEGGRHSVEEGGDDVEEGGTGAGSSSEAMEAEGSDNMAT